MVTLRQNAAEHERIAFLVHRDGQIAATAWVRRTLDIYRHSVNDHRSHASLPQYRPLFEDSTQVFEAWLKTHGSAPLE